jgi:hypothetical protein
MLAWRIAMRRGREHGDDSDGSGSDSDVARPTGPVDVWAGAYVYSVTALA